LGAYLDGNQVGFGRTITDRTVFAYLADVIIWPEYRGRGIGTRLVQALIDHPDCRTVIHWSLSTNDAHGLYVKARFQAIHQWPLYADRPPSTASTTRTCTTRDCCKIASLFGPDVFLVAVCLGDMLRHLYKNDSAIPLWEVPNATI
jgi:N-acetylglutamate synthase-like GNAT family acetyltransferase